jgi:hypothetical protein
LGSVKIVLLSAADKSNKRWLHDRRAVPDVTAAEEINRRFVVKEVGKQPLPDVLVLQVVTHKTP